MLNDRVFIEHRYHRRNKSVRRYRVIIIIKTYLGNRFRKRTRYCLITVLPCLVCVCMKYHTLYGFTYRILVTRTRFMTFYDPQEVTRNCNMFSTFLRVSNKDITVKGLHLLHRNRIITLRHTYRRRIRPRYIITLTINMNRISMLTIILRTHARTTPRDLIRRKMCTMTLQTRQHRVGMTADRKILNKRCIIGHNSLMRINGHNVIRFIRRYLHGFRRIIYITYLESITINCMAITIIVNGRIFIRTITTGNRNTILHRIDPRIRYHNIVNYYLNIRLYCTLGTGVF